MRNTHTVTRPSEAIQHPERLEKTPLGSTEQIIGKTALLSSCHQRLG